MTLKRRPRTKRKLGHQTEQLARLYSARLLLWAVDGKLISRFGNSWKQHADEISRFLGREDRELEDLSRRQIRRHLLEAEQACLRDNTEACLPQLKSVEQHFGLSRSESCLLSLAILLQDDPVLHNIASGVEGGRWYLISLISTLTGIGADIVRTDLNSSGRLHSTGLLVKRKGFRNDLDDMLTPSESIRFDELLDGGNSADLVRQMCPVMRPAELQLADFDHYRLDVALMSALLAGACAQGATGINILLYGPPGTGKTQLARALIEHADLQGTECVDTNRDGEPLKADDRLSRYLTTQTLLGSTSNAVVLFDEVEELLAEDPIPFQTVRRASDKSWKTRLLEQNARPTVWVCNTIRDIDPALLRRFSYALKVDVPPIVKRKELLDRAFAHNGLHADLISRVAEQTALTPADIDRTKRIMELIPRHRELDSNEQFARIISARPGGVKARPSQRAATACNLPYRVNWINANPGVMNVARMLERRGAGRLGLFGPPGTGKTAFAKHLASELGVRCVVKRASDLLGMFVGQTEQQIAAAFHEATDDNALLLIDEIDSFLQDRSHAVRSWEVSQVNELLTQIDNFDGYLVVASNFVERLDPALSRRIDLKIEFSPLTPAQLEDVFVEAACAMGSNESSSRNIWRLRRHSPDNLSLGDFSMAMRQSELLAETPDATVLLDCLLGESKRKSDSESRKIGFLASVN